jgi:segregation and condensation protein B
MESKALVEAALFVSEKPLTVAMLAEITGLKEIDIPDLIFQLQKDMAINGRGIELVQTPEGYELRLKPEYREKVSKLAPFSDLSEGMLRTLAIVVANQPVKQSVIIRYQGNKAYGYIESLEKKGLVRAEKSGRTKLVSTTPDFEKYFGMSIEEIKKKLENVKK